MAEQEKLSAAQRSKIRRLSQPKEISADEEGGELNIVPFLDIIMNVLMFVLATVSVTFTSSFDTTPPSRGKGGRASTAPSLGLTVLVVSDGFSMKTAHDNIATGCTGPGAGITVPKRPNAEGKVDFDFDGLRACSEKLRAEAEAFKDETQVAIISNNDIPYQVIVSTVDALRKTKAGEPMFPDVNFGSGK